MKKQSLLHIHAKSFSWAGFFLNKTTFQQCSILYDFCRTVDDIADSHLNLKIKKHNFLKFKNQFLQKRYATSIIKNIWQLLNKENISKKIILDLFDGVQSDLKSKHSIHNKKDLYIYCYRVAGTVGLMMAKILQVKDRNSLRGAIDLGIAMQLTNIARDVNEDKQNGRYYIKHNFNEIKKIIFKAELFYESAFVSCKKIPLRSRLAIVVARRIYRQIGRKILNKKNIYNYDKSGKIYVNNFEKILQTIFSLFDLLLLFFKTKTHHYMKSEHNLINTKIKLNERI